MKRLLTITDDSGFIAIANADKYLSFVDENFELPQLLNHFIVEMNKETFIVWATGLENTWIVSFLDQQSDQKAFREFKKTIDVTNGQLFLTNYDDLTMSAQFEEEKIPSVHNSELFIELENGKYIFLIRQMFDHKNYDYSQREKVDFEVIIQAEKGNPIKIDEIFWLKN